MRKYISILGVIIIFMTVCVGCQNNQSVTETSQEIEYSLEKFDRDEICNRRLSMYYGISDKVGIGISKSLYTEELAEEIEKTLNEDIKVIKDKFLELSSEGIEVYIIDNPLINKGYSVYTGGNRIYCTVDDIRNKTYQTSLVRASYNLTEPALIHGLTKYIFGETTDTDKLCSYYNEIDDISILGLSGSRFYDLWNSKDEIEIAVDTAAALVSYIDQSYSKEVIMTRFYDTSIKTEWLKSIGVNKSFENKNEIKQGYYTYTSNKEYPLIIKSPEVTYYMVPMEYLKNASDIELFLCKDKKGRECIYQYLEENVPTYLKDINKDKDLEYLFTQSKDAFSQVLPNGKIILTIPPFHLHEYAHTIALTSSFSHATKQWMREGIAEYLRYIISPNDYEMELMISDMEELNLIESPDLKEMWKDIWKYYKMYGGNNKLDIDNRKLYVDALAYGSFDSEIVFERSSFRPISQMYNIADEVDSLGNELNYKQACSFASYLIEEYSLKSYFDCYYIDDDTDKSFMEAFGVSYEEAKNNWLAYLERNPKD